MYGNLVSQGAFTHRLQVNLCPMMICTTRCLYTTRQISISLTTTTTAIVWLTKDGWIANWCVANKYLSNFLAQQLIGIAWTIYLVF